MKKLLSLALALALCLGLCAIPAAATGDAASAAQTRTVSSGNEYSAVIDENGSLWMWGHNELGQLGNGGTGNSTFIADDFYFRGSDSTRPCQTTPVKVMDDVVSVSCGNYHTAAIKTDGSLWMWGLNYHGELGNEKQGNQSLLNRYPYQTTPVKVMTGVVAVSCGFDHTAAITADGSLWTWGHNEQGQIGNGKINKQSADFIAAVEVCEVPVKVLDNVSQVSCGYGFTAAIKTDGTLWMWGDNSNGQLGNNKAGNFEKNSRPYQTVPVQVAADVTSVSCGNQVAAMVKTDGSLWTTGTGSLGTTGNGKEGDILTAWTQIGGSFSEVDFGSGHAFARGNNGQMYGWGDNSAGELGTLNRGSKRTVMNGSAILGYNYYVPTPTALTKLEGSITEISCGNWQTIAVLEDGSVWIWGVNGDSTLGVGSLADDTTSWGLPVLTEPARLSGLKAKQPGSFDPPSASSVSAMFDNTPQFSDVADGAYYADAVKWAVEKGITGGTTKTTFSPNSSCTKAQIVTFLWRAYGEPEPWTTNPWFSDSNRGAYHYLPLLWAKVNGMADGIAFLEPFGVNEPCTRAQAMLYIWQAAGSPEPTTKVSFSDVPSKASYAKAVAWAVGQGITGGTSATAFSPNTVCTRGQIVTFLYRAMNK